MTISDQIREAALYARDAYWDMPEVEWDACATLMTDEQFLYGTPDTDLRTFMLLVAEALE